MLRKHPAWRIGFDNLFQLRRGISDAGAIWYLPWLEKRGDLGVLDNKHWLKSDRP